MEIEEVLQRVQQEFEVLHLNEDKDISKYIWGAKFQSSRGYKEPLGHRHVHVFSSGYGNATTNPNIKFSFG